MAEKSKDALSTTVYTLVSLVVIVASFMYIHDQLSREGMIDVLVATIVFGAGLVYLFSNVWNRG